MRWNRKSKGNHQLNIGIRRRRQMGNDKAVIQLPPSKLLVRLPPMPVSFASVSQQLLVSKYIYQSFIRVKDSLAACNTESLKNIQLQKMFTYIAITCTLGAIVATCVAIDFQVNPHEINNEVRSLQAEQQNVITKEALVGQITEAVDQPLDLAAQTLQDHHDTPDAFQTNAKLASIQTDLEQLETERLEAQADLDRRDKLLLHAQEISMNAHRTAEEALGQLTRLTEALHESLDVYRAAEESSKLATSKLAERKSLTEKAELQLRSAQMQLQDMEVDYEVTKQATEIAKKSADEANRAAFGDEAGADTSNGEDAETQIH